MNATTYVGNLGSISLVTLLINTKLMQKSKYISELNPVQNLKDDQVGFTPDMQGSLT